MMLVLAILALTAAEPPVAAPVDDPPTDVAGLQTMYDQSCAAREYGAYDDLCDQLSQQLKQARVEADRESRRRAAEARHHPKPPPPQPATQAGPTAIASPLPTSPPL